jgi:hypothetical protein
MQGLSEIGRSSFELMAVNSGLTRGSLFILLPMTLPARPKERESMASGMSSDREDAAA